MSSTKEKFPKGAFVASGDGKIEGRVAATTEKFGGRVLVAFAYGDKRWHNATALRVVADHERVLSCDGACGGTGVFRGGGIILNGVYRGYEGPCYRCEGHGKQTPKDRGRNRYYDNNVRRVYV